jgi:hypothetical protein
MDSLSPIGQHGCFLGTRYISMTMYTIRFVYDPANITVTQPFSVPVQQLPVVDCVIDHASATGQDQQDV